MLQVVALVDGGRVRSSAYVVTQGEFVTQGALNGIDQEAEIDEEILPLGDPLHFQVSSTCGNGAYMAASHSCC